jgi:peptidoglycan hydrolase-like protein with peptidoglycan-binding domain
VPMSLNLRRCLVGLAGVLAALALMSLAATTPAHAALGDRTLVRGAKGKDVRDLQALLRRAGFRVRIDGVYGRTTFINVRRLQRELGLRATGRFTRTDLRRTRIALRPATSNGGFSTESMNRTRAVSSRQAAGSRAVLTSDGLAIPPADAPESVKKVIAAANEIAHKPYRYGGGHGSNGDRDSGYDCSGSVSYALRNAGLMKGSMPSGSFSSFGRAGAGKWITLYTNSGHMYMVVAGLRFDTSGRARTGSRWQRDTRSSSGFTVRHPDGL